MLCQLILKSSLKKIVDNQGAVVIVDGQEIFEIEENQSVKIKIAQKKVKMLHRIQRNFILKF